MCRLDSSVNCILNDILTSSLRFTSRIRKHWNKLLYMNTWLKQMYTFCLYTQHWVRTHTVHIVCLMSTYGPQSHMYLLYVPCWVWNKVIELNTIHASKNCYKFSYFPRKIRHWNSLTDAVVNISQLYVPERGALRFKYKLLSSVLCRPTLLLVKTSVMYSSETF